MGNLKCTLEVAALAGWDILKGLDTETFAYFDDELMISGKLSNEEIIDSVQRDKEIVSDIEEENIPSLTTPDLNNAESCLGILLPIKIWNNRPNFQVFCKTGKRYGRKISCSRITKKGNRLF